MEIIKLPITLSFCDQEELPENSGAYWAPGILDSRTIYYSVSSGEEVDAQVELLLLLIGEFLSSPFLKSF